MTHYHSITIGREDVDYPDNITIYGATGSDIAYEEPLTFEMIRKPIEAIMTSDDFIAWDYTEDEISDPFTVWASDGTALWTSVLDISYCYANIALEIKPLIRDGVEYTLADVYATSIFMAYSETYDEETDEYEYTYLGSSLNKSFDAEFVESTESTYIATVPRITGYGSEDTVPEGYNIYNEEYIVMTYVDSNNPDNVIYKVQPITIEQYYPDEDDE